LVANDLGLDFIICDDRKFQRKQRFVQEKAVAETVPLGFSFVLLTLLKLHLIDEAKLRELFHQIITANNWRNSIVEIANRRLVYDTIGIWL
jgi:hypothetical protein